MGAALSSLMDVSLSGLISNRLLAAAKRWNTRRPRWVSFAFWIVWLAMLVTHFHRFCDANCAVFKVRASLGHLKSSIHAVGFDDRKPCQAIRPAII